MTIQQLIPVLKAQPFHTPPSFANASIHHVVASDLMSDVLVAHVEDFILVTSLASDQMIRTADLVGAVGVVLVNGKQPPQSLTNLAKELDLPLLGTNLPKFEACLAIGNTLMQDTSP
ncbi:MAG: hypothetical protein ACNA71_06760 [Kiritimatiellia bacterium]